MNDQPRTHVLLGDQMMLDTGLVLGNIHSPRRCAGRPCVVHNPTQHHMISWPLVWRWDSVLFERTCPHGVGHPDPDQFSFWQQTGQEGKGIHGCDGCCRV